MATKKAKPKEPSLADALVESCASKPTNALDTLPPDVRAEVIDAAKRLAVGGINKRKAAEFMADRGFSQVTEHVWQRLIDKAKRGELE